MSKWLIPSLLLFAWTNCNLQNASVTVRVDTAFHNSSKFIHHALEEDDYATTKSSVVLDCMHQTLNYTENPLITEKSRRRLREIATEATTLALEFSDEFINCDEGHSDVEKGCYVKFPNGSVFVPVYRRLFKKTDYATQDNGDIVVCPEFFDNHVNGSGTKFPRALSIVTVVGTAVSTLCIVMHVCMFLALEKLRNLPGYSLFSMCIAMLVAYVCTFISHARKEPSDCTVLGIIKMYSFLASFFWMNVMSYDIRRSLRLATAKLRLTEQRPMTTRFTLYSTYAWGCPLLVVIVGFIVNSIDSSPGKYRLIISDDTCWFRHKVALQLYFAIPLFALLVLNALLFVSSFLMINSATMNTAENKAELWTIFLVSVRLAVVMGLMWLFGFLASYTKAEWLWYFYVLCSVLQGAFIFFSFSFTTKTREEYRKAIARKKSAIGEESGLFRSETRYVRPD